MVFGDDFAFRQRLESVIALRAPKERQDRKPSRDKDGLGPSDVFSDARFRSHSNHEDELLFGPAIDLLRSWMAAPVRSCNFSKFIGVLTPHGHRQ